MISLEKKQRLGYKAFLLMTFRRSFAGIILMILAMIMAVLSNYLFGIATKINLTENISDMIDVNATSIILIINLVIFWFGVLFFFLGILISYLEYITYTYELNELGFIIRKGILNKKENSITYDSVEDVSINRSIIYQLMGLSKLIIKTVGSAGKAEHEIVKIMIDPLDKGVAEEIRDILEKKIGVEYVKNTTNPTIK